MLDVTSYAVSLVPPVLTDGSPYCPIMLFETLLVCIRQREDSRLRAACLAASTGDPSKTGGGKSRRGGGSQGRLADE